MIDHLPPMGFKTWKEFYRMIFWTIVFSIPLDACLIAVVIYMIKR